MQGVNLADEHKYKHVKVPLNTHSLFYTLTLKNGIENNNYRNGEN